jgi:hypothetical protein
MSSLMEDAMSLPISGLLAIAHGTRSKRRYPGSGAGTPIRRLAKISSIVKLDLEPRL